MNLHKIQCIILTPEPRKSLEQKQFNVIRFFHTSREILNLQYNRRSLEGSRGGTGKNPPPPRNREIIG